MATTRLNLRQRIGGAGYAGDMIASTALTNATTTRIVDTTLMQPDDTFNGTSIYVTSGTSKGNERWITDWAQSTGYLTLDRAATAAITASDTYEIHRVWSASAKNSAINEAIQLSDMRWARRIEDTSLTLAATTFTYALTNFSVAVDRFTGLDEVLYNTGATGTGVPFQPLDREWWIVRDANGTLTLQLFYVPMAGGLQVVYRAPPAVFTADDSTGGTLDPDDRAFTNYICLKATAFLFDKEAVIRGGDARAYWDTRAREFHVRADAILYQKEEGARGQAQGEDLEDLNARIDQAAKRQGR